MSVVQNLKLTFKACRFAAGVGVNLASNVVSQTASTLQTGAQVLRDLNKGDYEKACERLGQRIQGVGLAVGGAIESACGLVDEAVTAKSADRFFTSRNARRVAQVAMVGLGTGLLIDAIDGDEAVVHDYGSNEAYGSTPAIDGVDPEAIENGMFVGDTDDLNALIVAGEQPDTEHIPSDEIQRDPTVREAFLKMHGYENTPEGYDVHHIVPVSEGGPDSVDNMVLVSEEEHDRITAAHRAYYGW